MMLKSLAAPDVQATLDAARANGGALFPSPADWRDAWIYFLLVDRFNNDAAPPRNLPYVAQFGRFQGGTFNGVRAQLDYLKELGAGALWLSPVLKNPPFDAGSYHGYGIQNFLAVEPRFASQPDQEEAELRQLVDAAHDRGIYVILDIVLHHAGDVFEYVAGQGAGAQELGSIEWQDAEAAVRWRDAQGHGDPQWSAAPADPPLDAAVWPSELRRNDFFTRRGNAMSRGFHPSGDFFSLKGLATDAGADGRHPVWNALIRAYQYAIARFDVDGFRIDTLKFVSPEFERTFANAVREFALAAGKKNFLTFGEVFDDETTIARFIGRNTRDVDEPVGVDAALDFPLFFKLPGMVKGQQVSPAEVAGVFETRKRVEQEILTSHGEAGKFFVTFLDNHDQVQRFGFTGPSQLTDQIAMGLACLFSLPGIPCLYYGTEQGLSGAKDEHHQDDSMVREALWGRTDAAGQPAGFDRQHPLYQAVKQLAGARREQPALRYGRLYFRPISGNGRTFGLSPFAPGVLAFSRILNDQEVVVVANTQLQQPASIEVIVDAELNPAGSSFRTLYSNRSSNAAPPPVAVATRAKGSVEVHEVNGSVTDGPLQVLPVALQAGEVKIFGR
jgi:glycosidase